MSCIGPMEHIVVELMPRKPLDSWVFSLLHLCAPVLPKGNIFANGVFFLLLIED